MQCSPKPLRPLLHEAFGLMGPESGARLAHIELVQLLRSFARMHQRESVQCAMETYMSTTTTTTDEKGPAQTVHVALDEART